MKRTAAFIFFCAVAAGAFADNTPVSPPVGVDFQGRTQLIAGIDNLDLLAEGLGRLEGADNTFGYRSMTLGAYYRVLPNLKLGAFYRLQAGARHDDDWVPQAASPSDWAWVDATGRWESELMIDASPRFQLGFLPGENWVLMLKSRFIYNFFDGEMSLLARPELTYFLIVDRVPLLNVALSWEMYFPLNFGSTLLYQNYPYLTLLWHLTPEVGIELGGAWKTTVWSTSAEWLAARDDTYSIEARTWVVSLGAVITLSF